jgi:hypothetical protein
MTYNTFQDMLDSLKPQQSALDFWREVDRWTGGNKRLRLGGRDDHS